MSESDLSEKKRKFIEAKNKMREAENKFRSVVFDIAEKHGKTIAMELVKKKLIESMIEDPLLDRSITVESVRLCSSLLSDLNSPGV